MEETIEPLVLVRDWSIDRIHELSDSLNPQDYLNAIAIAEEFDEWINFKAENNEISYLVLEDDSWTDDQEIDVK